MKKAIIIGTRPEIIKMSPIMRILEEEDFIIHTNQHYSENMDRIFLDELEVPQAKYNLNIGSGTHGDQTGRMLVEIEKVLEKEKPDVVLVQGDTNTVLAGAIAAAKIHIKVAHIEAGLRSYDREMPEELNRIMTDHISDYLFTPTKNQEKIALEENIEKEKIFTVGNTIVDAVKQNMKIAKQKSTIIKDLDLKEKEYIIITSHRPSNVDNEKSLQKIIDTIEEIATDYNQKIIFPIHPRTKNNIEKFKIKVPNVINIIDPVGYLDMLQLISNSKIILTDSGGIQEEACIMGVPCITLRENTERPETVDVGASILAGNDKKRIIEAYEVFQKKDVAWTNPFGDGTAGEKIMKILK